MYLTDSLPRFHGKGRFARGVEGKERTGSAPSSEARKERMSSTRETCYERRNHQPETNTSDEALNSETSGEGMTPADHQQRNRLYNQKEMSLTARKKSIGTLRSESHEGKRKSTTSLNAECYEEKTRQNGIDQIEVHERMTLTNHRNMIK